MHHLLAVAAGLAMVMWAGVPLQGQQAEPGGGGEAKGRPADRADGRQKQEGQPAPAVGAPHVEVVVPPYYDPYFWDYGWAPYWYYPRPLYWGPIIIPPEWLYGPQAIGRFMGLGYYRPPAVPNIIVLGKDKEQQGEAEKRAELRGTGQRSVELGWKFISYGDAHFEKQRYGDAYQRYKTAASVAPRLAPAYFRQCFALIAMGRYELAVEALKRGLSLDADFPRSGFRLDALYGENKLAKTAHLDALAKAATQDTKNADLLLLVGAFLVFDGQHERARLFLQRASQLRADRAEVVRPLLEATRGGAL